MAEQEFSLPVELRSKKDIMYWARRYPVSDRRKDDLLARILPHAIEKDRGLTYDELRFLFVWKSGPRNLRYLPDGPEGAALIERLTRKGLKEKCVKTLCDLPGIQIPTASAILHFAFPDEFPVIDRRVLVTTGYFTEEESLRKTIGLPLWVKFVRWSVQAVGRSDVTLRDLDRALWQFDVERSFRENYWPKQSPLTRK